MSGTSASVLQKNRLCYVSTLTSTNPKPNNDLDISTFMANRSNFYGGFSISHISCQNNFFNVTSKQTILNYTYKGNLYTLNIQPGYYYLDNLVKVVLEQIELNPNFDVLVPVNLLYDVKQNDGGLSTLECVGFQITPSLTNLAWVLGFEEQVYTKIGSSAPTNGFIYASDYHKLDRHSVLYLHSLALKQNTSFSGNGATSNFVQLIHNSEDYGGTAKYDDPGSPHDPQFIFDSVRDLAIIDFTIRDSKGELLETPTNNLHIVFRLFY